MVLVPQDAHRAVGVIMGEHVSANMVDIKLALIDGKRVVEVHAEELRSSLGPLTFHMTTEIKDGSTFTVNIINRPKVDVSTFSVESVMLLASISTVAEDVLSDLKTRERGFASVKRADGYCVSVLGPYFDSQSLVFLDPSLRIVRRAMERYGTCLWTAPRGLSIVLYRYRS